LGDDEEDGEAGSEGEDEFQYEEGKPGFESHR
jgi:hypothetical protein